jgi:ABC-2 type transport system permease protein
MIVGHLGLLLMAAAILSLGMFISSLTDSTILAAILTFALILFLWVVDMVATGIGGTLGAALSHFSLVKNYTNLVQGIFDPSNVIVFLTYIVLGLFLTAQSIEAFRFQRS